MNQFIIKNNILIQYKGNDKDVTIPNDVQIIGCQAFLGNKNLEHITIPNSVRIIRDLAFAYCKNLNNIKLPDSVTMICDGAFAGCINLTNIKLSNLLKAIGNKAFLNCKKLKNISIPSSVTYIGKDAFKIWIPDNANQAANNQQKESVGLQSAYIPDGITITKEETFSGGNQLKEVILSKAIHQTIEKQAA